MRQCSRRIFLKRGLRACSTSAVIFPLSARPVTPYYTVVFDERFGDVTNLFFSDLDLRWKLWLACLIGFTTSASPFCLHRLARDRIMMRLLSSDSSDLVVWIIGPGARASKKEIAIA